MSYFDCRMPTSFGDVRRVAEMDWSRAKVGHMVYMPVLNRDLKKEIPAPTERSINRSQENQHLQSAQPSSTATADIVKSASLLAKIQRRGDREY